MTETGTDEEKQSKGDPSAPAPTAPSEQAEPQAEEETVAKVGENAEHLGDVREPPIMAPPAFAIPGPRRFRVEEALQKVIRVDFIRLAQQRTIVCELSLRNGHVVNGQATVFNLEDFDQNIGCAEARKDAERKLIELEAYLQREEIYIQRDGTISPAKALDVLNTTMRHNYGYAYSWHVAVMKAIKAETEAAEQAELAPGDEPSLSSEQRVHNAAARFMFMALGIDTSKGPPPTPEVVVVTEKAGVPTAPGPEVAP